jgi:hypothetical protein
MIFLLLLVQISFGAKTHKLPKTLKQAIRFLNRDCPDSIKQKMKITPDDELDNLFYPSYGKYEAVYDWFVDDDNKFSGINKYLIDKGIVYHAREITLVAFKEFLVFGKFNENEIIDKYLEIEKYRVEQDKIRYTTDTLYGNYIPKDIEDCFRELDKMFSDSIKDEIKNMESDSFVFVTYSRFGRYLRNTWQLWGGSRLSKYLYNHGACQAEGMSSYILGFYNDYLKGKKVNLEKNDTFCNQYYERQRFERKQEIMLEYSKFKIGDTIIYQYNNGYVSKKQENAEFEEKCIAKGIIVAKDDSIFNLKVKLINTCSRKGLVYSDNKNTQTYNYDTKRWEDPIEREIIYVHKRNIWWFYYSDWKSIEE